MKKFFERGREKAFFSKKFSPKKATTLIKELHNGFTKFFA